MMTRVWVVLIVFATIMGVISGRIPEVSIAITKGASGAVELILSIIGIMCLWSGIMRVLSESGLASKIARMMRPVLKLLFRNAANDQEALELISGNITANLLGLANAATPIGLKAADRLQKISGGKEASDELITFIVINTASIQLIPTTVAAVRSMLGSAKPYDILPAVWLSSSISVTAGLTAAFLFRKLAKRKKNRK
ncbi:MAG: spore maturation protein A [Clostridiales bacterium]|nr:spore maturation protein A [Clostridiales bacterium]